MSAASPVFTQNKSLVERLSDHRGRELRGTGSVLSPADRLAVERLGAVVAACCDVGFVARTRDTGEYGVALEWEMPWSGSHEEYASLMMWGEKDDADIVDAVTRWANLISNVAHVREVPHRVCVLVESEDVDGGNLGVHLFIPERAADNAPEVARLSDDIYGSLTEQ